MLIVLGSENAYYNQVAVYTVHIQVSAKEQNHKIKTKSKPTDDE